MSPDALDVASNTDPNDPVPSVAPTDKNTPECERLFFVMVIITHCSQVLVHTNRYFTPIFDALLRRFVCPVAFTLNTSKKIGACTCYVVCTERKHRNSFALYHEPKHRTPIQRGSAAPVYSFPNSPPRRSAADSATTACLSSAHKKKRAINAGLYENNIAHSLQLNTAQQKHSC